MHTLRTIIVDDDVSASNTLEEILEEQSDLTIIGVYKDGSSALNAINSQDPELIFIEIDLPDISGFELAERIICEPKPLMIFTSVVKDYGSQAFEMEAWDYLQKPYQQQRLVKSFDRLHRRIENGVLSGAEEVGNVVSEINKFQSLERFIIKQSGEYHLVRTKNIMFIESDGNYSRIITANKKFMVRHTLTGFENQLNANRFYRISRSQIVNLDYVVKIKDHVYGNYIVELNNGTTLKMSKNYKHLFQALKNF